MVLFVRLSVGPLAPSLAVPLNDLIRAIKLEAFRALIDELLQMLKPRFGPLKLGVRFFCSSLFANKPRIFDIAGNAIVLPCFGDIFRDVRLEPGFARRAGETLFFITEQIVRAAKPQRKLESHAIERTDERMPAFWSPVRENETILAPLFLERPVIMRIHPTRLKPDNIARQIAIAELPRLVQKIEHVDILVRDKRKAIAERREHLRATGKLGVDVQQLSWPLAGEDIEVKLALGRGADKRVLVRLADIEMVAPGRIYKNAPPLRCMRHRNGNVAIDVLDPNLVGIAAALNVLAAHVA